MSKRDIRYQSVTGVACHEIHDWVTVGDKLRTGDRSVWLTVTGFHERNRRYSYRDEYYDTVELEGNGITYHLLCWDEDGSLGPMLYRERDWETEHEDPLNEYSYPRNGERVAEIELNVRYAASPLTEQLYRVTDWEPRGAGGIVAKQKEAVEPSEVPSAWLELLLEDDDA